jgi:phosphoglycerate dehydrogenase-like enzyme
VYPLICPIEASSEPVNLAILDDYQKLALGAADWTPVRAKCDVTVFDKAFVDLDEAAKTLRPFDILCLMRERTDFPTSLLIRLPNLKLIVATGAHNRTIDLAYAERAGIRIVYTGAASTELPTAELTWALILATARNITRQEASLRSGGWQQFTGRTLHGRTLGLLGVGRIGARVAAVGRAFGMRTIGWSPNLTPERASAAGVTFTDKSELFASADVISLHIVLSEATKGIVGHADIAKMKSDAVLINTSRSQLVDGDALFQALNGRLIGGAGLDVFDTEPLSLTDRLLALDNVVLTPHLGYATIDVYEAFYLRTVECVLGFLSGSTPHSNMAAH